MRTLQNTIIGTCIGYVSQGLLQEKWPVFMVGFTVGIVTAAYIISTSPKRKEP